MNKIPFTLTPKSGLICFILIVVLLLTTTSCTDPDILPLPTEAGDSTTIQIGLLSPNRGELLTFGRWLRNGSLMAFDEWNEGGGLMNQRITGHIYDTQCDFESGQQAAQQAMADGIQHLIGPLCSEAAIGAAVAVDEAGEALLIVPTATHPLVTVDGQGHTRSLVFRGVNSWSQQGQLMAHFAEQALGVKRVAVLSLPHDNYSTALAEAFAQQVAGNGAVVYRASYPTTSTDVETVLENIAAADAEAIYLPAPAEAVNQMAAQMVAAEMIIPLLGSDSWRGETLDMAGFPQAYFADHVALSQVDPTWADRYQAFYALEPDALAVLGYDAAMILLTAIQQAESLEPTVIASQLEQSQPDALFSFDDHHNPLRPLPVFMIQEEQLEFVERISR